MVSSAGLASTCFASSCSLILSSRGLCLWQVLTQRLLASKGVKASLEAVTAKFEELYQGTDTTPGLCATERLITPKVGCSAPKGSGGVGA